MNNINDGGPAFPDEWKEGMSLRDYFAAKAMQALMHPNIAAELPSGRETEYIVSGAYEMADAMLAARGKA